MKLARSIALATAVSLTAVSAASAQEASTVTVTTAADGTLLYGGLTLPAAAALAGLTIAAFLAAVSGSSSASTT